MHFRRNISPGLGLKGRRHSAVAVWLGLVSILLFGAGCAKYNTYYNAKRSFDDAEHVRNEAIRKHQDPPEPGGAQKTNYLEAIKTAQKVLDDYPGHSLTDDALFLQAKAHSRLASYRQSIMKLDLLFLNFPATEYNEEALYLQALSYLMIGALDRSQEFLEKLDTQFPDSKYQSKTLKVSGDNSYTLEDWETAAASYQKYMDSFPDDGEMDRIGLKLAECYWELERYQDASEVLQIVDQSTTSAELGFRSRLLRARVHVHLGDFEVVDLLFKGLEEEAPIYTAEGEVVLVGAESMVAQGRGEDAGTLIESMPEDWNTPTVKARAADILGYLYMERGDLKEAAEQFTFAVRGRDELDDINQTKILANNLQDYLSAEEALPDARAERVPRLKLLQANALLFGFKRPAEAGLLFREAGLDSAADSLLAPRGLYGAVVVYRDYLDMPDSADYYSALLEEHYPDSPQAFDLRMGTEGDLLGFLLAQKQSVQSTYLATLSPEELDELQKSSLTSGAGRAGRRSEFEGVRRRMVYLSRRDNMVFDPPDGAVQAAQLRLEVQRQKMVQDAAEVEAMDEKLRAEGMFGTDGPDSSFSRESEFQVNPDGDSVLYPGPGELQIQQPETTDAVGGQETKPEEQTEEVKEEEKKDDGGGFDLR